MTDDVTGRLAHHGVVPVVVVDDSADAPRLVEALRSGGLPCAEVTFRTPAAEHALSRLAENPDMLVGAGTVRSPEQVDRALAAGARFVVAPGLDPAVVRRCRKLGIPIIPGVATASEVTAAAGMGIDVVKLFPATQLGGPAMLTALAGPFPDMRWVPTGGIGAADVAGYLAHPAVVAVGGSWMVARSLLATRDFERVRELTADAVARVAAAREGAGR